MWTGLLGLASFFWQQQELVTHLVARFADGRVAVAGVDESHQQVMETCGHAAAHLRRDGERGRTV